MRYNQNSLNLGAAGSEKKKSKGAAARGRKGTLKRKK
jgi:hypothetical protein